MAGGIQHVVLSGPLILAVPVAAAAGAVTFLSPCVLPLVPGYLSYVTGMSGADAQAPAPQAARGPAAGTAAGSPADPAGGPAAEAAGRAVGTLPAAARSGPAGGAGGQRSRHRTLAGTALFVLGFSLVFATEGVAFGGFGALLKNHSTGLTQLLGGLTIVLGLLFAGLLDRFPATGRIVRPSVRPRAGLAGAPLLGALFGLSWTPCIGPTLSVVLLLATTSGTAVRGALLMFVYGLGLGIPFLLVALAFQRGVAALGFARRHARAITRAGGVMLVAVGVLEVSGAWTAALTWLQAHWIGGYQAPL